MTCDFRSEIAMFYTDATGLVCNRQCAPTDVNPSGNGPCYTGEFMAIYARDYTVTSGDKKWFAETIMKCMVEPGLLSRGPGQPDLESVDDYYGVLAGCQVSGTSGIADAMINYGWRHNWSFDNTKPGRWRWQSFLARQPQLVCAMYTAAGRAPLWVRLLLRPVTAAVIATSCAFTPKSDFDARRLSWLLIQTMAPVSWLCRKAAGIWAKRLLKDYPGQGMRTVASMGFSPGHPFVDSYPTF